MCVCGCADLHRTQLLRELPEQRVVNLVRDDFGAGGGPAGFECRYGRGSVGRA